MASMEKMVQFVQQLVSMKSAKIFSHLRLNIKVILLCILFVNLFSSILMLKLLELLKNPQQKKMTMSKIFMKILNKYLMIWFNWEKKNELCKTLMKFWLNICRTAVKSVFLKRSEDSFFNQGSTLIKDPRNSLIPKLNSRNDWSRCQKFSSTWAEA